MTPSVAVAAVTFDRPRELAVLLDAINNQTAPVRSICLVDSGTVPSKDVADQHANVDYVRSEANLGGAGGFSLAILKAVASGADWIWMMDDDAEPADPECLATLLREAQDRGPGRRRARSWWPPATRTSCPFSSGWTARSPMSVPRWKRSGSCPTTDTSSTAP